MVEAREIHDNLSLTFDFHGKKSSMPSRVVNLSHVILTKYIRIVHLLMCMITITIICNKKRNTYGPAFISHFGRETSKLCLLSLD